MTTAELRAAARQCTCHPDDSPPNPCAEQYALNQCNSAVRSHLTREDLLALLDSHETALASERQRADALAREVERLRGLLARSREHVWTQNSAEHMLDGFGPRSARPSDGLLAEIDATLTSEAGHGG